MPDQWLPWLAVESGVTTKGRGGEMLSRFGGGHGTVPQTNWWLHDNAHLSQLRNCKKVRKETVKDEFIICNFLKGICFRRQRIYVTANQGPCVLPALSGTVS